MAMMVGEPTRWLLSLLFAVTGLWYLIACLRAAGSGYWQAAIGAAAHAVMSAAMIGSSWAWGARIPTGAQVSVFSAATAWYLAQAMRPAKAVDARCDPAPAAAQAQPWRSDGRSTTVRTVSGLQSVRAVAGPRRWLCGGLYHAAMMATMVWMAAVMASGQRVSAGASNTVSDPMPGMAMPGMADGGMKMSSSTGWASVVSLLIGGGFCLAAAWFAITGVRTAAAGGRGHPSRLAEDGIQALMALGMAISLLEMA